MDGNSSNSNPDNLEAAIAQDFNNDRQNQGLIRRREGGNMLLGNDASIARADEDDSSTALAGAIFSRFKRRNSNAVSLDMLGQSELSVNAEKSESFDDVVEDLRNKVHSAQPLVETPLMSHVEECQTCMTTFRNTLRFDTSFRKKVLVVAMLGLVATAVFTVSPRNDVSVEKANPRMRFLNIFKRSHRKKPWWFKKQCLMHKRNWVNKYDICDRNCKGYFKGQPENIEKCVKYNPIPTRETRSLRPTATPTTHPTRGFVPRPSPVLTKETRSLRPTASPTTLPTRGFAPRPSPVLTKETRSLIPTASPTTLPTRGFAPRPDVQSRETRSLRPTASPTIHPTRGFAPRP